MSPNATPGTVFAGFRQAFGQSPRPAILLPPASVAGFGTFRLPCAFAKPAMNGEPCRRWRNCTSSRKPTMALLKDSFSFPGFETIVTLGEDVANGSRWPDNDRRKICMFALTVLKENTPPPESADGLPIQTIRSRTFAVTQSAAPWRRPETVDGVGEKTPVYSQSVFSSALCLLPRLLLLRPWLPSINPSPIPGRSGPHGGLERPARDASTAAEMASIRRPPA